MNYRPRGRGISNLSGGVPSVPKSPVIDARSRCLHHPASSLSFFIPDHFGHFCPRQSSQENQRTPSEITHRTLSTHADLNSPLHPCHPLTNYPHPLVTPFPRYQGYRSKAQVGDCLYRIGRDSFEHQKPSPSLTLLSPATWAGAFRKAPRHAPHGRLMRNVARTPKKSLHSQLSF